MSALTRLKLGYLPGSMDAVYLVQDIAAMDAMLGAGPQPLPDSVLGDSMELESEARRLQRREIIAKVLLQRADIFLARGNNRAALEPLAEAEQVLGDFRAHDLRVGIEARKVEALARLEDWPAVLAVCGEAIPLVEKHRYQVSGQYLQRGYLRSRIRIYSRGIQAAYHQGDHETVLSWAELSKCRSVLRCQDQASSSDGTAEETADQFHRVCQQIDQVRAQAQQDDSGELQRLRRKRRILWDLLLIRRARAGRDRSPVPEFTSGIVRSSLAEDEAIVYYYWLEPHSLLIIDLSFELCDGAEADAQLEMLNRELGRLKDLERVQLYREEPLRTRRGHRGGHRGHHYGGAGESGAGI
jgi:hypothetical protein